MDLQDISGLGGATPSSGESGTNLFERPGVPADLGVRPLSASGADTLADSDKTPLTLNIAEFML